MATGYRLGNNTVYDSRGFYFGAATVTWEMGSTGSTATIGNGFYPNGYTKNNGKISGSGDITVPINSGYYLNSSWTTSSGSGGYRTSGTVYYSSWGSVNCRQWGSGTAAQYSFSSWNYSSATITSFTYYSGTISALTGGIVKSGSTTIAGSGQTVSKMYEGTNTVTLTAVASDNQHYFTGWSDGSTDATHTFTLTDNFAITAYFAAKVYLSASAEHGSFVTDPTGWVVPNSTVHAKSQAESQDYRFSGWYSNGQLVATTEEADLPVGSSNISYVARYVSRYHTVTVGLDDSSSGCGTVKMQVDGEDVASGTSLFEGTEVTFVCTPGVDYNFGHWKKNNVAYAYSSSYSYIITDADDSSIAFLASLTEKNTYGITVTKVDPSRGTVKLADREKSWNEPSGQNYISATGHSGVRYTVTANVTSSTSSTGREMNKFSGFTKNGERLTSTEVEPGVKYEATFTNGSNITSESLDDVSIVATFAQKSLWHAETNVPILAGGTATIEPSPDTEVSYEGHPAPYPRWLEGTVTAVATPNTGYYVNNFNVTDLNPIGGNGHVYTPVVDADGKYRDSFTLNFNAKITVNFQKIPCSVYVNVDPASAAANAGTATVASTAQGGSTDHMVYGDIAIYTATAYATYAFGGWYLENGNPAPDSTIVDQGVSHTYHYTDPEYRVSLTGNLRLIAKFKAKVRIAIATTTSAHGSIRLDDQTSSSSAIEKMVVIGSTCQIEAIPQTSGTDFFGSWYLASDTEFTNPLDLSSSETITVLNTTNYVARFISDADSLYVAMCNYDNDTEQPNASLGILTMLTSGSTPVEVQTCTEQQYLSGTGLSVVPYGVVKYYKIVGTSRVTIGATPNAGRGFSHWSRLTVSGGTIGIETQLSLVSAYSTVVNRHYIYRAYWGDPKPARITLNYCLGSNVTNGNLNIEGIEVVDPGIMDKTQTGVETSATFTQNDIIKIFVDIKNGYLFDGWYYDSEHMNPLRDSVVDGVTYHSTDAEYRFKVGSPVTICAKFKEDTNALYKWEGSSERKMMTWKSKVYASNRPFDPSSCRVDATGYAVGVGGALQITVDMFSSPNDISSPTSTRTIPLHSQDMRRLPPRRPERYLQVQVENNNDVNAIIVGTSAQGVAS